MTTSASFIDFKIDIAEQYKSHVSEPNSPKVYFAYGKTDAWINENSPNAATTTVASMYDVWNNMIGGKLVTGADLQHVIPRYNWTTGNVYFAYDDKNPQMNDGNVQFYILTTDWNVYKCIANNAGANSTTMPSAVNPDTTTQTADGYIWKYMYTVSDNEKLRFVTDQYIPVKTLSGDDGSRQWAVQEAAVEGAINSIIVTSGGSNYTSAPSVTITGDGSGALATASINSTTNTVSSITVTSVGQAYSYANVAFSGGGGSSATARVIISPMGGHGSDPLYELGGRNLLLNMRLVNSEDGVLPISNDYRQISLLHEPTISNTTINFANSVFMQAYTLNTNPTSTGNYDENELVYQGSSLASATFSGRVLTWNSISSVVTTINNRGNPATGTLIGANTGTSRELTSYKLGELEPYSAKVMYIDHIKPVTRSSDQTEDFKIIIKF